MSSKTAIILMSAMVIVSGIFFVYLYFTVNPLEGNESMPVGKEKVEGNEAPIIDDSMTEYQKRQEILKKLDDFRNSTKGTSTENISSSSNSQLDMEKAESIEEKQAKILSDLEKFRNSIKK